MGTVDVCVKCNRQEAVLPLVVVRGARPSLLGRNWLNKLKLNWEELFWVHDITLKEILDKYKGVFEKGLGTVREFKAKIAIDHQATPKFLEHSLFLSGESGKGARTVSA